jgi:SAM-dependent methyltransferase
VTVRATLQSSLGRLLRRPDGEQLDVDVMKRDWDARARENAMHYIVNDRLDWDIDEFLASGSDAFEQTLERDLELVCAGRPPGELRLLEIGCGIGRMTRTLAGVFGEVHGVDVSGEMVSRGRELLADVPNAHLVETDGSTLSVFPDAFVDVAYSFIVFQHVPYREVVVSNLREVHRTLRPGGFAKFQVQGVVLPGERDTWVGVGFAEAELDELAEQLDFDVVRKDGAGTQYFWNVWRRRDGREHAGQR